MENWHVFEGLALPRKRKPNYILRTGQGNIPIRVEVEKAIEFIKCRVVQVRGARKDQKA